MKPIKWSAIGTDVGTSQISLTNIDGIEWIDGIDGIDGIERLTISK